MNNKTPKLIVTLGPATRSEDDLRKMKDKSVDFVRINMSHSTVDDLQYFLDLTNRVEVPFIIDTEGSQLRTGDLSERELPMQAGDRIRLFRDAVVGDAQGMTLKPAGVIDQLQIGDLLFIGFGTLVLRISDVTSLSSGYIEASVVTPGALGQNKAVVVASATGQKIVPPVLTKKDHQSIALGIEAGIGHIALSYVRRGEDLDEVRIATHNTMQIISKIESRESLEHFDEILQKTDAILLDRGDLSKEVPIERVPHIQKEVISKANAAGVPVYVATNFLESMVENRKSTRAEVSDVVNTILDGADGLMLSAETAVGKYPMDCINTMQRLMTQTARSEGSLSSLDSKELTGIGLPMPHGGRLVNRVKAAPSQGLNHNVVIPLTKELQMDVEQIAVGTYSPLEGFLNELDFLSVLDRMRLADGTIWPLPIVLDVSEQVAARITSGDEVALTDDAGDIIGVLHVEDIYRFDKASAAKKIFLTNDPSHPGVRNLMNMQPVLLGGKIDLYKRRSSPHKEYELSPRQTRRLFEDRGWNKVAAFHTRNVIHKGHEFLQMHALDKAHCDGLFVQPVVGKKKPGDFEARYIIAAYEKMMKDVYPKDKVVFAVFPTYSRYAGPREALFTALCRKNYGCSHFIVGRDHTGVGTYYHPYASHHIFNRFPEAGITPIKFGKVFYSQTLERHVHERDEIEETNLGELHISGTEARRMMEAQQAPPEWFMRSEISEIILEALRNNETVFVKDESV